MATPEPVHATLPPRSSMSNKRLPTGSPPRRGRPTTRFRRRAAAALAPRRLRLGSHPKALSKPPQKSVVIGPTLSLAGRRPPVQFLRGGGGHRLCASRRRLRDASSRAASRSRERASRRHFRSDTAPPGPHTPRPALRRSHPPIRRRSSKVSSGPRTSSSASWTAPRTSPPPWSSASPQVPGRRHHFLPQRFLPPPRPLFASRFRARGLALIVNVDRAPRTARRRAARAARGRRDGAPARRAGGPSQRAVPQRRGGDPAGPHRAGAAARRDRCAIGAGALVDALYAGSARARAPLP